VLKGRPLDWVKARFESPYGTIRSEWRIRDGMLTLRVSVPPNTTCMLYVPTKNPNSVKEGGTPFQTVSGVKHQRDEKGRSILELQPGQYNFEAEL